MPVRWGSTYKLLKGTYIYREVISDFYNNDMGEDILTQQLWDIAKTFCNFLSIFDKATTYFSYVYQSRIKMSLLK